MSSAARSLRRDEAEMVAHLKGQSFLMPNMLALTPTFESCLNAHYTLSKAATEEWLRTATDDPAIFQSTIKADFSRFAAGCYPRASRERFEALSRYAGWLFLWDDVIDSGCLSLNTAAIHKYVQETINLTKTFQRSLCTPCPSANAPVILQSWSSVDMSLRSGMSHKSYQRHIQEIIRTFEEIDRRSGHDHVSFPKVKDYLHFRRASSATFDLVALIDFAYELCLPAEILEHEALVTIAEQTCDLVAFGNDIISFPREFKALELENLVSLIAFEERCTLEQAVDRSVDILNQAYCKFVEAEDRLPWTGDADIDSDIKTWVEACKNIVAANSDWSIKCARYLGKDRETTADGKIFIQL